MTLDIQIKHWLRKNRFITEDCFPCSIRHIYIIGKVLTFDESFNLKDEYQFILWLNVSLEYISKCFVAALGCDFFSDIINNMSSVSFSDTGRKLLAIMIEGFLHSLLFLRNSNIVSWTLEIIIFYLWNDRFPLFKILTPTLKYISPF